MLELADSCSIAAMDVLSNGARRTMGARRETTSGPLPPIKKDRAVIFASKPHHQLDNQKVRSTMILQATSQDIRPLSGLNAGSGILSVSTITLDQSTAQQIQSKSESHWSHRYKQQSPNTRKPPPRSSPLKFLMRQHKPLLPKSKPIPQRKTNNRRHNRPRIIHALPRNRQKGRERQESNAVDPPSQAQAVNRHAPFSEAPGARGWEAAFEAADDY